MPREKRDRIERLDEVQDFLYQSNISARNIQRLKKLVAHPDSEVPKLATLVLAVARVHPYKRRRWRHLAVRHRDLFHRAVEVLGADFFYEVLLDYGDTSGPLWDALAECRVIAQEAASRSSPPTDSAADDKQRATEPAVCHKLSGSLH